MSSPSPRKRDGLGFTKPNAMKMCFSRCSNQLDVAKRSSKEKGHLKVGSERGKIILAIGNDSRENRGDTKQDWEVKKYVGGNK